MCHVTEDNISTLELSKLRLNNMREFCENWTLQWFSHLQKMYKSFEKL